MTNTPNPNLRNRSAQVSAWAYEALVCGVIGLILIALVAVSTAFAAAWLGVMTEGLVLGFGFFAAVPGVIVALLAVIFALRWLTQPRGDVAYRRSAIAGMTLGLAGMAMFTALLLIAFLTNWPAGPT